VLAAVTDRTEAGGTTDRAAHDVRDGALDAGAAAGRERVRRDRQRRRSRAHRGGVAYLRRAAYAAASTDGIASARGRYELTGSFAASSVRGSASAITRTQRSSVHQYQRPDDDLVVDTTRTSLEGTSLRVVAKKIAGLVRGTVSYQRITPGYETNDFGFLPAADEQILNTSLRFIPSKPSARGATRSLEFYGQRHFTTDGLPTTALYEAYANGSLKTARTTPSTPWVDNAWPG
jgi:hypothetical protein